MHISKNTKRGKGIKLVHQATSIQQRAAPQPSNRDKPQQTKKKQFLRDRN